MHIASLYFPIIAFHVPVKKNSEVKKPLVASSHIMHSIPHPVTIRVIGLRKNLEIGQIT